MTPERWQEIEGLFQSALLRDPAERSTFVERACGEDKELRNEVTVLLSVEEASRAFLTKTALEVVASQVAQRDRTAVGQVVGHYLLEATLGSGGMGEVYLAIDQRMNRRVALKLLPDHFNNDPQRVHRFQQEAQAVLKLNHPNIVTTYEVGEVDGVSFIASEYIEGETLRQLLNRRTMGVPEVIEIATQIAGALVAAHDAGIVHRDIKPANIMLRPDDYVKVLDFGIAKLDGQSTSSSARPESIHSTSPGMLIGTTHYMSPEQARGIGVDGRSDLWSLGVVLYEMLAGRLPFPGDTRSDCIAAILERSPAALEQDAPDVPAELSQIVETLLCKDREERYQTARDLLADLRELKHEVAVRTRLDQSVDAAKENPGKVAAASEAHLNVRDRHESADSDGLVNPSAAPLVARNPRGRILNYFAHYRWAAAGALLVALLLVIAGVKYFPANKQSINSVAVLPFVSVGGDANSEYLADGVTESLINDLSQLPNVKVIARSSVFRYKSTDPQAGVPDPQKVARELNVQAVLIGRISQRGDDLVVSVELVGAKDNSHIWGGQYNRKVSQVFAVQEQIARDISDELRLTLTGTAGNPLARHDTNNVKAMAYYMQGRSYIHRRTREDLTMAASYYQKAIDEDSNYALAYAGLAEVYGNLGARGYIPPAEGRRKLEEAARKAVALDPNLAAAHVMMGNFYGVFAPHDFASSDRELKRAIELSPSLAIAHLYLALSLLKQGHLDEGLAEMLKARELDPFSAIINRQVALYYFLKRDYVRALQILHEANALGPPFTTTSEVGIYIQNGAYDEALAALDKESRERKDDPLLIYSRGMVYAAQGRRTEALTIIKELERLAGANFSQAQWIAKIYAMMNEKEQAFIWLDRGLSTGTFGVFYKSDPTWDILRADSRFATFVGRLGVPQ